MLVIYKQLLDSLSSLSRIQLKDLSTRIQLLLETSGTQQHAGKQDFGSRVLQAVCDCLKRQRAETPSVTSLRKSAAYVSSKSKIDDLSVFIQSLSKSKIVQDQILKIAIDLLYVDLLNWQGISVSSHTLLKQIHRIPATLNQHFPGYASSGLLVVLTGEAM